MARRVRPAVKFVLILILAAVLIVVYLSVRKAGLIDKAAEQIAPKGKLAGQTTTPEAQKAVKAGAPKITVAINTWGGYAPGLYFNGGFGGSTASRYYKEMGIIVEFVLIEDLKNMRDIWKAGKVDIIGLATIDSVPAEINDIMDMKPQVFIKVDDSRGGDVVVGTAAIKRAKDLEGKKVALLTMSPSHTLLLVWCEADGADPKKIELVGKVDGVAPGEDFKAGAVPAAIVWAPVDQDCIKNVPGAHVVFNTAKATKAISDVFITSDNFIQKNRDLLKKFTEGWLIAAAEINSNEKAKREAARIMSESPMKVSLEEGLDMINRARLSTYGDNQQFFSLKPGGVTGEEMYNKMYKLYRNAGVVKDNIPAWRQIANSSLISAITLAGKEHDPEESVKFAAPTTTEKTAPAFAEKAASVRFAFGSAELTSDGKIAIDTYFANQAKEFGGTRVRIEGNTDNVGGVDYNEKLSFTRARSVASYLVSKYHFDQNRFIIVGNGFRKPVPGCESNATEECRAQNRRTEFALLY